MSHFITCKPNNEGNIQAFFELPTKISYEISLVELFYSLSWKVSFGSLGLIINGNLFEQELVLYDYSPIDVLQQSLDEIVRKNNLNVSPTIKYDSSKKQIVFESNDPKVQFKIGTVLRDYLGLNIDIFSKMRVVSGAKLEQVKLIHVYCDVVADQVFGLAKSKLLRTHRVVGDFNKMSSMVYTYPHYLSLSRSTFQYINIWITDEKNNTLKFEKEFFVKVHLRQKR